MVRRPATFARKQIPAVSARGALVWFFPSALLAALVRVPVEALPAVVVRQYGAAGATEFGGDGRKVLPVHQPFEGATVLVGPGRERGFDGPSSAGPLVCSGGHVGSVVGAGQTFHRKDCIGKIGIRPYHRLGQERFPSCPCLLAWAAICGSHKTLPWISLSIFPRKGESIAEFEKTPETAVASDGRRGDRQA